MSPVASTFRTRRIPRAPPNVGIQLSKEKCRKTGHLRAPIRASSTCIASHRSLARYGGSKRRAGPSHTAFALGNALCICVKTVDTEADYDSGATQ